MTKYIKFAEFQQKAKDDYDLIVLDTDISYLVINRQYGSEEDQLKFMKEDMVPEDLDPREILQKVDKIMASRKPMSYYLQDPIGC